MGKYVSWEDFEKKAPAAWARNTDPAEYRKGMNRIAPPDTEVKEERVSAYEEHTTEEIGRKKWIPSYVDAMFKEKRE